MRGIERAAHRAMLADLQANGYPYLRLPHIALLAHVTTDGRRLTEFAELMQITKPAASQVVSFLVSKGLLERVPDPSDGRASLIRATDKSLPGFRIARQCYARLEDEWAAVLGPRRLAELVRTLRELEAWATADSRAVPRRRRRSHRQVTDSAARVT